MFLMFVISRVKHREDHVGLIEERQGHVLQQRRRVDHDQVVRRAQRRDDLGQVIGRDELGHLGAGRRHQHAHPRRVLDERRLERLEIARRGHLAHDVGDRLVLRVEVEQHADVAELEPAVDERDAQVELRPGRDREVDRQRRPSDTALGREEADDLAVPAAQRRRCGAGRGCRPARWRRGPSSAARADRPDGWMPRARRC
jgi:hypothetical protein